MFLQKYIKLEIPASIKHRRQSKKVTHRLGQRLLRTVIAQTLGNNCHERHKSKVGTLSQYETFTKMQLKGI